MKEKDFVSYEQALALKELGFDEPCFGYYHNLGSKQLLISLRNLKEDNNSEIEYFVAPTYSQAFRWFREKYGLNSHIHQEDKNNYSYCCGQGYSDEIGGYQDFKTYEEAELECLKKLIEILKNK
jgi:hypothetical protein